MQNNVYNKGGEALMMFALSVWRIMLGGCRLVHGWPQAEESRAMKAKQRQGVDGVLERTGVDVMARDGVSLATDFYFPAVAGVLAGGVHPAILLRTPYNRQGAAAELRRYAQLGYVGVAQDCRGRYGSGGEFTPYLNEANDGYDTMAWICRQPWSDGRIGTYGSSYAAALQSAAACQHPPGLSAMVIEVGPHSSFHSSMRHNGALELRFLVFAFNMAATSREALADPALAAILKEAADHVWDYLRCGPLRPGLTPLALVPAYESWAISIATHGCYDLFWQHPGYGPRPYFHHYPDIPTLYIGGWYDTYTRGTLENYIMQSAKQQSAVQAVIGPWTHGGVGGRSAGDADFGVAAEVDVSDLRRRWFGQWLLGEKQGLEANRRLRYFSMGEAGARASGGIERGGEWHSSVAWPPENSRKVFFFLHPEGELAPCRWEGEDGQSSFVYDPDDPVPCIGGNLSAMPLPAGVFDQRDDARFLGRGHGLPLSARNDILCFVSRPLKNPLTLAGPLRVQLHVSSSAPDTDFTVKLVDLCPPSAGAAAGLALNISDSICRLRFHQGYEREALVKPGQVVLLEFELYPTACVFGRGHRLRLDISSSNYPRFDVNPNSGEALGRHRLTRKAINTVYHNARQPSGIFLPVMHYPAVEQRPGGSSGVRVADVRQAKET